MNRYGLSKHIPIDVKRAVRQGCFFGCVICGRMPYQYDHFDPEFADASQHDAARIALLCPNCHQEKTSGRLANRTVAQARIHPFNRDKEARWKPYLGSDPLRLMLGNNILEGPAIGLSVNGHTIFGVRAPLNGNDPWLFTGMLSDSDGKGLLVFEDDEARVQRGIWDVQLVGTTLSVLTPKGTIAASVELRAKDRMIVLSRLSMGLANGNSIEIDERSLTVGTQRFTGGYFRTHSAGASIISVGPAPRTMPAFPTLMFNDPSFGTSADWGR